MAEILPIWRKTLYNQSIILRQPFRTFFYMLNAWTNIYIIIQYWTTLLLIRFLLTVYGNMFSKSTEGEAKPNMLWTWTTNIFELTVAPTSTSHNALELVAVVAVVLAVALRNTYCCFLYSSPVRNICSSAWNSLTTSPYRFYRLIN